PWLSQRRNKKWYRLAAGGAAFYPNLITDLGEELDDSAIYHRTGTLIFKKNLQLLEKLERIALKRKTEAPEIGELSILSPEEIREKISFLKTDAPALFASGGAKVDGSLLTKKLKAAAKHNGALLMNKKVSLEIDPSRKNSYLIKDKTNTKRFDKVVLAAGAWLPQLLEPLGYDVDIRPQKGQLFKVHLDAETKNWPVVMPAGEWDIIPFSKGEVIIGATHENDQGYDLRPAVEPLEIMFQGVKKSFPKLDQIEIAGIRVGTRAYTSDFAPFFGEVPQLPNVYAASGLGASGLTSGPLIAHILVQLITDVTTDLPLEDYPIDRYIKKKTT
ncbi:MAG: FAD-binding oxidoreductase, partial [Pisciglobus halotolerans]|nr:FAD-binding oxidoreductase [Pisciglobus halotolerans]